MPHARGRLRRSTARAVMRNTFVARRLFALSAWCALLIMLTTTCRRREPSARTGGRFSLDVDLDRDAVLFELVAEERERTS